LNINDKTPYIKITITIIVRHPPLHPPDGCGIKFFKKDVATDDIIDASVLAVTGLLGLENGFRTIPENPPEDSQGLKMSITVMKRG
jgi:hypothetical protein